jgi:hypothetical protein
MKKTLSFLHTGILVLNSVGPIAGPLPLRFLFEPTTAFIKPVRSSTMLVNTLAPANQEPGNAAEISPQNYNVFIRTDDRLLIMLAALNLAGYDYDPSGELSALRTSIRADLQATPSDLVARLRSYYTTHRIGGSREENISIAPYIGLALSLSSAPSLTLPPVIKNLPADVREIASFVPLIQEFYVRSNIRDLLPKYRQALQPLQQQYDQTARSVLYETLSYLHTEPLLILPPTPIFDGEEDLLNSMLNPTATSPGKDNAAAKDNKAKSNDKSDKTKSSNAASSDKTNKTNTSNELATKLTAPRVRRLLIFLNPLGATGSIFQRNDLLNATDTDVNRRIGDEYTITVAAQSLQDSLRYGFLRFVLDPIVGKNSVEIADLKEKTAPLLLPLTQAKESARRNIYELVGDSLARAVSVRLTARSAGKNFNPDEAAFLLSQYYEQGAVLVFHFHDKLQDLERAGVDIREFVAPMLAQIDFEREKIRLAANQAARTRFEQNRNAAKVAAKATAKALETIINIDALIKQRQYDQARAALEVLLREQPRNARALFGMAQVFNNQLSPIERDTNTSDEEKIAAQEERLAQAVKFYREAINTANDQEKWLVSQSHVLLGRIFDFVEQPQAALAEYNAAIKLGDIPQGAYREAVEAKNHLEKP